MKSCKQLLKELGRTSNQIAANLAKAKIKGHAWSATLCPIANYLRIKMRANEAIVGLKDYAVKKRKGDRCKFKKLPKAIARFIADFDTGSYPELRIAL